MKLYSLLTTSQTREGEVYGWTTYSYVASKQDNPDGIILKKDGREYLASRDTFEINPTFDIKKHDNMCAGCYFTSPAILVAFIRAGLMAYARALEQRAMKLYPRKI